MFGQLLGQARQHLGRLLLIAQRDQRPHQPGPSLRLLPVSLHRGGKMLRRRLGVPLFQQFLALRDQISPRRRGPRHFQQALHEPLHLALRQRAGERIRQLPLPEPDHGRHRLQRQPHPGQLRHQRLVLIHIDLHQPHPPALRAHDFFQHWRQGFARPAPRRPEIHQHGNLAGRLKHIGHKGGLIAVNNHIGRRCRSRVRLGTEEAAHRS